jgi:hypothetical protein
LFRIEPGEGGGESSSSKKGVLRHSGQYIVWADIVRTQIHHHNQTQNRRKKPLHHLRKKKNKTLENLLLKKTIRNYGRNSLRVLNLLLKRRRRMSLLRLHHRRRRRKRRERRKRRKKHLYPGVVKKRGYVADRVGFAEADCDSNDAHSSR